MIARITVQHVTRDESENPENQQVIRNYHIKLESAIGKYEFMLDIDGMGALINEEVTSQEEEDIWEQSYQGLPYSPDMEMLCIKKILKRLLTSMISLLDLRYVYLMNEGYK